MQNFMTVAQAKLKIQELSRYVYLAETLEAKSLDDQMIKHYAHLGSLNKVVHKMNQLGYEIEVDDVRAALQQTSISELHKIIRVGYMKRTRAGRFK